MKKFKSQITNFHVVVLSIALLFVVSCKSTRTTSNVEKTKESGLSGKNRVEFENYFFDANKQKILGNYPEAEALFLQALRTNPNSAATMYELANIYSFQNKKKEALYFSKKAAAIDPANSWYQLLYIDCLTQLQQYAQAVEVYKKLLKQYPNRVEYYYELANLYLTLNKGIEAIKSYDEVEKVSGVTDEVSMQKVRIYKILGDSDKAIEEVLKLIKEFPEESKYYGILGELYQARGESEKAFQVYSDLIKLRPNDPYAHLTLADYYRNKHEKEKAFEEIKIAFKSPELDIDTKVKILLSYYSISETHTEMRADADELCKIIVEVHPLDAKAFAMYGDFLYRDEKLKEAREQYRKAVALDKEKYVIWNQLLLIESELNDYEAMQKESKEAMELFPNQPLPYFLNGAANLQLKNYEVAVTALNEGKEFVFNNNPLLSQFYANLGDGYNHLKKYTESDAAYDKALEINPKSSYVLNNYAYYLSLRKDKLEKAEQMSKKSLELEPGSNSYQDTYGWILYQMNRYEDAKIWIGKAIENGGAGNGTLLEHYGDILFKLNEVNEALSYWEKAKKAGGTTDLIDKKIADKKLYE